MNFTQTETFTLDVEDGQNVNQISQSINFPFDISDGQVYLNWVILIPDDTMLIAETQADNVTVEVGATLEFIWEGETMLSHSGSISNSNYLYDEEGELPVNVENFGNSDGTEFKDTNVDLYIPEYVDVEFTWEGDGSITYEVVGDQQIDIDVKMAGRKVE